MLIHFNCRLYSGLRTVHRGGRDNADVRRQGRESEKCVARLFDLPGKIARVPLLSHLRISDDERELREFVTF